MSFVVLIIGSSRSNHLGAQGTFSDNNEQALVSLKFKKSIDAEGGRTFAVIIEGG